MAEVAEGTALEAACSWLDAVIRNTGDSATDLGVWALTHESWRCQIAGLYLGPDHADVGCGSNITALDEPEDLARFAVLCFREALPATLLVASGRESIGLTQIALPQSPDCLEVVFSDVGLEPGWHHVPAGTRVGFALNAVYEAEPGWWTIASVKPDWLMPEWFGNLHDAPATQA